VIEQLKMDDNVDVFTAVRQLQKRRPEFCSTQVCTDAIILTHSKILFHPNF
jgi:hypothetical protein